MLESTVEYCWREKDSTETSCDRKRRFSGSHSRHPLSRLCQPPPFDVPLFRSFRSADSSRVPLLVSLAARLADYTSAYITTALRQFDSSIRGISSGFVLRLHFLLFLLLLFHLLRFPLSSICPVLRNNSTKLLHLHHSTVAAPLGISRCSFVIYRQRNFRFWMLREIERKRERRERGRERERKEEGREREERNDGVNDELLWH